MPSYLPLQGLTVLVVEDSRYASDAMRLMCQRSGARLRRAEDLATADSHLRCYRPDIVIVDLGLPDGRGEDLIRRLALTPGMVVLGTSGDPDGSVAALDAGAEAFLPKPIPGLAAFQEAILALLPDFSRRPPPVAGEIQADPMALEDDLRVAETALRRGPDSQEQLWLAGFLAGLARQSQDADLAAASVEVKQGLQSFVPIADLLRARILQSSAFGQASLSKGGGDLGQRAERPPSVAPERRAAAGFFSSALIGWPISGRESKGPDPEVPPS